MTTRKRKRSERPIREASTFPELRLKWIDRVVDSIRAYPGAPPGTDIARTGTRLGELVLAYREGFVAALNLSQPSRGSTRPR